MPTSKTKRIKMSFGYFVDQSRQQRQDIRRAGERAAAERAAKRERAKALVAEHFDSDGTTPGGGVYLDGWAVMAVLNLWREHGEGNVTLGQVRRERARLLERLRTHGPNSQRPRLAREPEAA